MAGSKDYSWVLAADNGQDGSPHMGQYVKLLLAGVLTVRSFNDPEVAEWRAKTGSVQAARIPTLFAINDREVRAWTGLAMMWQMARLLGPRRVWRTATTLGALVDPDPGPAMPERRRFLRHGATGLAAAAVVLFGGLPEPRFSALAQMSDEVVETEASRAWSVDELDNRSFDRMRERATGDRNFNIIRDHFASDRDWEGQGRIALKISRRGDILRKLYGQQFKRKGEPRYVNVTFGQEAGGKDWTRGYVWRGNNVTNEYFVQNGNLRDDGGRVPDGGAQVTSEGFPIDECTIDAVLCRGVVFLGCGTAGLAAAGMCGPTGGSSCIALSGVIAGCGIEGGSLITNCESWASEGKCA